jgi:hypothetical protein
LTSVSAADGASIQIFSDGPALHRALLGFAMTTSKMIAGLMGPTLVAIAAAMVLNFASIPELAEQVSRDPGLIFLSGILLFVAGIAIVRVHNVWVGGWPVLVTVLGWVAVLSGLFTDAFPDPGGGNRGRGCPETRRDHCRRRHPFSPGRLSLV